MLVSSLRRECERIERAGGCAQMPLGQMKVDRSNFKVSMAEQYLNGAQVGAGFEKMCGEAVTQSVWMNAPVLKSSALSSDLAGRP